MATVMASLPGSGTSSMFSRTTSSAPVMQLQQQAAPLPQTQASSQAVYRAPAQTTAPAVVQQSAYVGPSSSAIMPFPQDSALYQPGGGGPPPFFDTGPGGGDGGQHEEQPKKKKWILWGGILFALIAAGGGYWYMTRGKKGGGAAAPRGGGGAAAPRRKYHGAGKFRRRVRRRITA